MRPEQTRTYDRASSVVFLKTDEPFGGLSNMAGGFLLRVNGLRILTLEALYQACRFPHRPEVQALIIEQKSPMTAKMKSKPYRHDSRPDWDQVRVKIMRWCLRVKLAQNWHAFSELLLETGERPIVEESWKDAFWGAKATDDGTLVGMNVLGRLLMELREAVRVEGRESLMSVQPLAIPDFLLGGRPIEIVTSQIPERDVEPGKAAVTPDRGDADGRTFRQPSLFDEPVVKEGPPAPYAAVRAQGVHVADLKPYEEYKESGLPWLGQVPGHWETKRGKSYLTTIDERSKTGREELLTVSSARGVVPRSSANVTMFKAESYAGHKLCWPGDLVINSLWAWAGGLGVSQHHGIISTAYSVYRSRPSAQVNPRFLHELVRSSAFHWELQVRSKGVWISRLQLTDTAFLDAPIPLPPPDEQAVIVRFLDWANGRLERAIRAKRKVIALLNEQKQAIVHRAVTRGLDPSVPLKPSGIPWLGDIPQHWEVRRLKHLARFQSGDGITSMEIEAAGPYPVYGGNGLRGYTHRYTHDGHYALIGRQGALCGNINLASGQFFASEHAVVPTLQSDMSVVWFGELLRVMNLNQYSQSAAQPGLAVERIKNLYAPVPPINEQKTIVESFERDTAPLAAAMSRLAREIELLREYRTRIVADVVTGKLDVRDAAARLPDEAPLDTIEVDADLDDETAAADEEAAV